jgi:hypothetical protein
MSKTKITRKGSGRTKGSYSFATVTLAELNAKFAPDTKIVIGRKWGQVVGFNGLTQSVPLKPLAVSTPAEQPADGQTGGATVMDLN